MKHSCMCLNYKFILSVKFLNIIIIKEVEILKLILKSKIGCSMDFTSLSEYSECSVGCVWIDIVSQIVAVMSLGPGIF